METSRASVGLKHGRRAGAIAALLRGPRPIATSLRTRIVISLVGLLALATFATVVVTRDVLLDRLDQRIDAELIQETDELRQLATGDDPKTGKPFGPRANRIFDVYLKRNVPSQHEMFVTFLNGSPHLRSANAVPYRLDRDPELVARWGRLSGEPERGRAKTPAGRVEYLAVPLRTAEGRTVGVFVAAVFHDGAKVEVDEAVRATALVGLVILLLGSLLAWRFADRIIDPVTALTRTARSISGTELSGRIPLRGRDEVAQLAATFNDMLDRLEGAFASQRRFLDDVGHELRTPLTIVRGHLELLEDDPRAREESLALIIDELDRMNRIIHDLLLLAQQARPDFLNLVTLDVAALTDAVHAKAKGLAPREWVLERRGQGVIVGDRQRLTQAMLQLAHNAARYSDEAEPIGIGSAVTKDGEARLWVRDRGPGIPAEERDSVFERLSRGASGRAADGAGLGLAIVKAIAEAHHGRVELESRPGDGTLFTIVVPVDPPDGREAATR